MVSQIISGCRLGYESTNEIVNGCTKVAPALLMLQKSTAKHAKCAKLYDILYKLDGIFTSKILPDINLVKPCEIVFYSSSP
jgi:hypothetical protein